MFHIGQRVVCVDDSASWGDLAPLKSGVVYTVRDLVPNHVHPFWKIAADCIRLEEITDRHDDFPYMASRFRPLTERKTDTGMAILRKLLQPKHERV